MNNLSFVINLLKHEKNSNRFVFDVGFGCLQ